MFISPAALQSRADSLSERQSSQLSQLDWDAPPPTDLRQRRRLEGDKAESPPDEPGSNPVVARDHRPLKKWLSKTSE